MVHRIEPQVVSNVTSKYKEDHPQYIAKVFIYLFMIITTFDTDHEKSNCVRRLSRGGIIMLVFVFRILTRQQ